VSASALTRMGRAQPVKDGTGQTGLFDVVLSGGQRDRYGVPNSAGGQWKQPFRPQVDITVQRAGVCHVVGRGAPLVDRKGNLRVRGVWASTPLGEHVRTLVAQRVLLYAEVDFIATIDDQGWTVYDVCGASFMLPADPPWCSSHSATVIAENSGSAPSVWRALAGPNLSTSFLNFLAELRSSKRSGRLLAIQPVEDLQVGAAIFARATSK
jgi:hypothetical protein